MLDRFCSIFLGNGICPRHGVPIILRIAFANTFDSRGGAARAAYRLFTGIYALPGIDAKMVVQDKCTDHPGVVTPVLGLSADTTSRLDARDLKAAHPNRVRAPFSVNWFAGKGISVLCKLKPDIVHMHWPHCGFIRIERLVKLGVPIVWTIHDMWAFTGVCHYSQGCKGYLSGCGRCPLLDSDDPNDVSAHVYQRKASTYPKLDLTVVSPSNWLASIARNSPLLGDVNVEIIPNGIDVDRFKPEVQAKSRNILGLPQDKPLVLFGADFALADHRKGGEQLISSLYAEKIPVDLVLFGHKGHILPNENIYVHNMGYIHDEAKLALIYSACDLYVLPSREDNLPNTVMESMSCGTPVLSFDVGGISDMVDHNENGFLVDFQCNGMDGIIRLLITAVADRDLLLKMGIRARAKILKKFSLETVTYRYLELYCNVKTYITPSIT